MTRRCIRIATTYIVPDHQAVTIDDMKRHLRTIDHVIVPVYSVHDPRLPPIGRVVSGVIVELNDGEYALDVNVELFDSEFIPDCGISLDKRVVMLNKPLGKYGIWCNLTLMTPEKICLLREISEILKTPVSSGSSTGIYQEELFMVIIGIRALRFGYIADTFSRWLDCEKVQQLTRIFTRLYRDPGDKQSDSLLIFDLDVTDRQKRALLIEVIMTNPSGKAIESFFTVGLGELDRILPPFYLSRLHPKKIVINYSDCRFRVLYAIQDQGIPMIPRSVSLHG